MKGWLVATAIIHVTASTCVLPSPFTLQLILEYAKWRSWDQIVVFENLNPIDCAFTFTRPLIECLGKQGISVSIQSSINPNIPDALTIRKHRIGSIVLLDGLNVTSSENVLHVASQKMLFNYYISWLMITTRSTDATIDTLLRDLNIGIDSDVVVATSSLSHVAIQNLSRTYWNRTCLSFRRYGNNYQFREPPERRIDENALPNLSYAILENRTVLFYFVHIYKIRQSDNASLVTNFLGSWSPDSWTLRAPVNVKLRNDFKGLPIVFGVLNGTNDGQTDVIDEVVANDISPLLEFATFVTNRLNASTDLVPHEKLGTFNNKVWSNLLGDVATGAVDIGLGYITINDERLAEMTFSHPLIRYMRNVYYHPLETGIMRDIFRQPFNNGLLGCVASTYLAILIAMGLIIYAKKTVLHHEEEKSAGLGEAVLWCFSIMCMQGSPWSPRNPSGKTVLLFSLMFALVTYNAYAGFITSILSVQASGIKSITDLLFHNFKLGYSVTDDEYIRNVNDSNLRELYIRAFNSRESRLDTTSGLMKAVNGHYGFFVSATLARRALRTRLIQERCTLKELPLPQTFTVVALPMANSCPYKKIINLNILRTREHGVLNRITEKMLPEMPRCKSPTTFHSARLADVYSAFLILIAGGVTAITLGVVERLWNKRKQMKDRIVRGIRQRHLMPHFHRFPHFPHFPHVELQQDHHANQPRDHLFIRDPLIDNGFAVVDLSRVSRMGYPDNRDENRETINDSPEKRAGSRLEKRLSVSRRHSGLKRVSWSSFSGLSKKKHGPDRTTGTKDNSVFPFQN